MTMPDTPDSDFDGEDLLAAELALGLLEGDELAAARRRQLADPAFAREVERWDRYFAAFFGAVAPVEPSVAAETRAMGIPDMPATGVSPMWRWLALASSLVAACLLGVILLSPERVRVVMAPAPPPPLVAAIAPGEAKPFGAVYDPSRGQVRLADGVAVPDGRTAELWVIGADGVPHALGLLSGTGGTALVVIPANRRRLDAGATLAISIEPMGGSPTGLPTGPVVASGALTRI